MYKTVTLTIFSFIFLALPFSIAAQNEADDTPNEEIAWAIDRQRINWGLRWK
jgi:hypothetical protein